MIVGIVSILIPCYNAERWVAQAIESALAQTWPDKEILVVDDGSTDGSLAIIRSFGSRIRWETGPNRGGNAARNRLLELARGEWLQYLDADDYLLPDKVAGQIGFLAAHPDTDLVFGPVLMEYWDESKTRREPLPIPEPHDPWILLARWFLPQTGSPLWRKLAVVAAGGWKPDQPCCQEHELYLRLLATGARFEYRDVAGAVYRQWSAGTVCRRDAAEVNRRRLEIKLRAEEHLRRTNQLTPARQSALNQARFEIARMVWRYDRKTASSIVRALLDNDPCFLPNGPAAPGLYPWAYRLLGFPAAEHLAQWKRNLACMLAPLARKTQESGSKRKDLLCRCFQ